MVDLASDKKLSPSEMEFGAVVGQEELKEALLAVMANDALSGLLIQGEKGTAKSTAVRGLVDLLPEQRTIADCPFGCPPDHPGAQCGDCREREEPPVERRPVPLVTLPLGATRERVVGTLSVADALEGETEFDPGLLARANRGVLYVDEVNLLDDHLVDVLLDSAASGVNRVERDGVSVSHPAEFTLIGTMNPEEGDLRPQLRDRFALRASVTGSTDLDERVAIIDRALDVSRGRPEGEEATETERSRDRLLTARDRLEEVALPEEFKREIAELCRDAGVDGHRADIATARGARTFAALDDRPRVLESDVRRAAALALPHRLQSRPFEDAPDPEDVLDDHFDDETGDDEAAEEGTEGEDEDRSRSETGEDEPGETGDRTDDGQRGPDPDDDDDVESDGNSAGNVGEDGGNGGSERPPSTASSAGTNDDRSDEEGDESTDGNGDDDDDRGESDDSDEEATPLIPGQATAGVGQAAAPELEPNSPVRTPNDDAGATGGSRARATPSAAGNGSRVRTERANPDEAVDAAASIRAAASRGSDCVESRDLRRSVRAGDRSALVVFALDASASMRGPMRAAKGVVMELLRDAYEQRDEVSVVAFAGEDGEVLLPPTDSVTMAARHLKELPTADRTPLPAGLRTAGEVLERADPAVGVVVLVTDGRANAGNGSPTAETREAAQRLAALDAHVVVVDAGDPDDRATLTEVVARTTDGERVALSALSAEAIEAAVVRARERA
ncbi:VWA domain-containing protein [Halalkalicoccus salilacus]|uniref:VWA domain-containing protein n=1 Tax=Halalkalicoccus salilacus TaxID=3117459 RepID=UPI00300EBAE2